MRFEQYRLGLALACAAAILPILPGRFDPVAHPRALLFGFVPMLLLAFMNVSLPRWLGRPVRPSFAIPSFMGLNGLALAGVGLGIPAFAQLQTISAALFAALVLGNVLAARSWRSLYPVALMVIHSWAGILDFWQPGNETALHLGITAVVLLCLEIGNRIAFALAATAHENRKDLPLAATPPVIVWTERLAAGVALLTWASASPSAPAASVAAAAGAVRLVRLRPWALISTPGILAVACGLAWSHVGFVLEALSAIGRAPPAAPVHAWCVGGLGLLSIAVATSIVRKKERRPFSRSLLAESAFIAVAMAAGARIGASVLPGFSTPLLQTAMLLWNFAFAACLAFVARGAFGRTRCHRQHV